MVERKHLLKLKKFVNSGRKGFNLSKTLLCAIALGEKLSPDFYDNRRVTQSLYGLRRYRFVRHSDNGNYLLTEKGKARVQNLVINEIEIKQSSHWDKK